MDPTKPSLSSKAAHVNNGGGNESVMEEAALQWRDGVEEARQRDTDSRDTDMVDGTIAAAETNQHHRGSADKNKFNSVGYQRRTKQKVVTDFATVSKGTSAGAKPRTALRQVLFSQGVSDKNPTSEDRGQLDVLKQDLQAFAVPVSLKWRWEEESRGTTLENNWTDIVHSHSTMSKMQRHQQEALWEFVHTELTYINKLIIIKDLVVTTLLYLHQRGFLLEVTPELLFSNLPSIIAAHQLFWQEVIFPMLQEVRQTAQPFDPMRLEAGCLQFPERFSSYQHYCWEEENNMEFTRRQMESNPHFLTYVQWVETHPQCERMRLGDMQAKPHQRITKYPLLLKAVLKTTQDANTQFALRGMLSSVNNFLESINDYLRLKDEELALAISAQRVEGYEVEGINEEIDKLVREIAQFDLTCPIRGVGPEVVRKLLLEENLKIRGRKESKWLEVVALLFSDVLLMTKVQKKGERLKVVRPPLALDRTFCIRLKDGCSFVLVEVGELRSAMNVYIFAASSSENCSKWFSTIHQAKETLRNLREIEHIRQLQNWKIQQPETKPVTDHNMDYLETDEQPLPGSRQTFVDELKEEIIVPQSINGMLASKEAEDQYEPQDHVTTNNTGFPLWQSHRNKINHKSSQKSSAGPQEPTRSYEWIEMGVRGEQVGVNQEEEGKIEESVITNEGRVARLNYRVHSAPNLDHFPHSIAAEQRYNTTGPHALLLGGYPDIDYPTDENTASQLPHQPTTDKEGPRPPSAGGISAKADSDFQPVKQDLRINSMYSQSGDFETLPKVWTFPQNLKSPGLRRRRPVSSYHGTYAQMSRQFLQDSAEAYPHSNSHSSSNSDSEYNKSIKRNSLPPGNSSDSMRVLKLGSLKPNQGMFWYMNDRVSPDPQTLSESELPDRNYYYNKPSIKTKRSASIPNIVIEGSHGPRLHSSSLSTLHQIEDTQDPGHIPNRQPSPLEGLLERAKGRQRDRGGLRRNRQVKVFHLRPPPSPSFSTTPSPPPSDGDRDTEWEEVVEVMRHRALTVSQGWKEQLVDGDVDDRRNSFVFSDGVNVDWSGWCFDDDEVMDHLQPLDEGLLEGISRSLTFWDLHGPSEHDDGEISHV